MYIINVLLVHALPLSRLGGAELSLSEHVRGAPEGVRIDIALPDDDRNLDAYDAVIIGNIRPDGGGGEAAELTPALYWADRLKNFRGFSLKSERDIHPCTHRDARCIAGRQLAYIGCDCSDLVRDAFTELYNSCSAVQFLSPGHKRVVNKIIGITSRQYVIAPPVDLRHFGVTTPWRQREPMALILGDRVRVAPTAEDRARRAGFQPRRLPYLSIAHADMPRLYNEHRAVVIDPVMYHAFGRMAVEALASGCKVLASERVGAMSWWNPRRACRNANPRFWKLLRDGCRHASSRRWRER